VSTDPTGVYVDEQPPNSAIGPDGRRWYTHPVRTTPDGGPQRYISVTSFLDATTPHDGLPPWYGNLAGDLAMEHLPLLIKAARIEPCAGGIDRCRGCSACAARWLAETGKRESERRTDEGKKFHYAVKMWVAFGGGDFVPEMDPEIKPYFETFRKFAAAHGITAADVILSETTVLNHTHGYAGTLDLAVRIYTSAAPAAAELVAKVTGGWEVDHVDLLVDLKSRERANPAFYIDMGLQVVGYAGAEVIMHPDGTEEPMPALDGAIVLQVRPDGYDYRVVDLGEQESRGFLAHLEAFRFQIEQAAFMGVRSHPLPDEMQGTKAATARVLSANPHRKPPRKTAARKATKKASRSTVPVEPGVAMTVTRGTPVGASQGTIDELRGKHPSPRLAAAVLGAPTSDDGLFAEDEPGF